MNSKVSLIHDSLGSEWYITKGKGVDASLDWPPPDPEREDQPWTNGEGERLEDFGVDEETEVYGAEEDGGGDDDVPLAELIRRRREE